MSGWGSSRWGSSLWGFGDSTAGVLYAKLSVLPSLIASKLTALPLFSGKGTITVTMNEKALSTASMQFTKSSVVPAIQVAATVVGKIQIKSLTIIPLS